MPVMNPLALISPSPSEALSTSKGLIGFTKSAAKMIAQPGVSSVASHFVARFVAGAAGCCGRRRKPLRLVDHGA